MRPHTSLRTFFLLFAAVAAFTVVVVLVGLGFAVYGHWSVRWQEERATLELQPYGGVYSLASALDNRQFRGQPEWVVQNFTNYVKAVDLSPLNWAAKQRQSTILPVDDAALVVVQKFPNLRSLDLRDTCVTDAGLVHLKGLRQLEKLVLLNTRVTSEGVQGIQQALPNCRVDYEPPTKDKRQSPAAPDQLR